MSRLDFDQKRDPTVGKALIPSCKARYAVLFQIWTFPSRSEDEAHIGPTATYDTAICPGFQHDITTLQLQGYNISYNRHTTALIQYISGRYMSEYRLQSNAYWQREKHRSHNHTGPGSLPGSAKLVVVESPRETSITIPVIDEEP